MSGARPLIMRVGRRPAGRHATIGIMATVLLVLVVVLVIGGLVFGVVSLLSGDDPGLVPADPDERARPLPNDRSLREEDLKEVRFDVVLRGYRMTQVDRMLRRTAYDLGYKDEMIAVLEAEVIALREGRREDAELLRKARESAASPPSRPAATDAAWPVAAPTDAEGDEDEAAPEPRATEGEVAPDPRATEGEVTSPPVTDRTDSAPADEEPDLPREGSLRRREPAVVDAIAGGDASAGAGTIAPDPAAIDAADRPAHA